MQCRDTGTVGIIISWSWQESNYLKFWHIARGEIAHLYNSRSRHKAGQQPPLKSKRTHQRFKHTWAVAVVEMRLGNSFKFLSCRAKSGAKSQRDGTWRCWDYDLCIFLWGFTLFLTAIRIVTVINFYLKFWVSSWIELVGYVVLSPIMTPHHRCTSLLDVLGKIFEKTLEEGISPYHHLLHPILF